MRLYYLSGMLLSNQEMHFKLKLQQKPPIHFSNLDLNLSDLSNYRMNAFFFHTWRQQKNTASLLLKKLQSDAVITIRTIKETYQLTWLKNTDAYSLGDLPVLDLNTRLKLVMLLKPQS